MLFTLLIQLNGAQLRDSKTFYSVELINWYCYHNVNLETFIGKYVMIRPNLIQQNGACEADNQLSQRVGRMLSFKLKPSTEESSTNEVMLDNVYEKDMAGILDMKWSRKPLNGLPAFAVADSEGVISVWNLQEMDEISIQCFQKVSVDEFEQGSLALSLDWNNAVHNRSVHLWKVLCLRSL